MNLKGTLPTLILHTLERGPNHGYRIAQHIKSKSKGVLDFKEGTLYPALHGLENKGYIESYEETHNGRTRRYYRLTETGHKKLAKERKEWRQLAGAVSFILEEA
jgi:transcriptional regulator